MVDIPTGQKNKELFDFFGDYFLAKMSIKIGLKSRI